MDPIYNTSRLLHPSLVIVNIGSRHVAAKHHVTNIAYNLQHFYKKKPANINYMVSFSLTKLKFHSTKFIEKLN